MRIDFAHLEAINARARKERAEAAYELLIAPLGKLFAALKSPVKPQRTSRWLAVHGK